MTTVLLVSGSWPPQACGVGDYSHVLGEELAKAGIAVRRFANDRFSRLYAPDIIAEIQRSDCDLVHIQYPTAGYSRSLTPSAIARLVRDRPVIVTLHEYSVFRFYRRPWFASYASHCAARIFTTEEERGLFARRFPRRSGIDATIEIGSNVPAASPRERESHLVCYFGLIAPNKGLEDFLSLAELSRTTASALNFEMIGAVPGRFRNYADGIIARAGSLGIRLSLHLPNDAVAERLATAAFAYLPFPDGATAKRGTLAAAFVNGATVVTRHTALTPGWIRQASLDTTAPQEALAAIIRLRADAAARADLGHRTTVAAEHFRWDAIAEQHVALYRSLLNQPVEARARPRGTGSLGRALSTSR